MLIQNQPSSDFYSPTDQSDHLNFFLLTSNQNLTITSAQAISTSSRQENGKTDHATIKSNLETSEGKTISSTLEAENITLASAGDITLQAAKIKTIPSSLERSSEDLMRSSSSDELKDDGLGNINITAANNLQILANQDFATNSETNNSKTTYSKSIGNSGSVNTEIINTEISTADPIKLKLDAGNLIYAEYSANSQNPLTTYDYHNPQPTF